MPKSSLPAMAALLRPSATVLATWMSRPASRLRLCCAWTVAPTMWMSWRTASATSWPVMRPNRWLMFCASICTAWRPAMVPETLFRSAPAAVSCRFTRWPDSKAPLPSRSLQEDSSTLVLWCFSCSYWRLNLLKSNRTGSDSYLTHGFDLLPVIANLFDPNTRLNFHQNFQFPQGIHGFFRWFVFFHRVFV